MALHLKLLNSKGLHRALFISFFAFFLLSLMSCENGLSKMRERLLSKWDKYTVTLTQPVSGGTITANPAIPGDGRVSEGTVIKFTVSPETNHRVKSWSGATVNPGNPNEATLTVNGDVAVSATMVRQYKVTLTQPVSGGTISAAIEGANTEIPEGGKFFDVGTEITFTVNPAEGYWVGSWRGATVSDDVNVATLTVSEDVIVSASIIPAGFVEVVTPPEAFFTTLETSTDLSSANPAAPGSPLPDFHYRGVFYENRRVKLSPYCMGKTEVTYRLWKEVHDWAMGHGYYFAHAGQKGAIWGGYDPDLHSDLEPVTLVS